MFNQSMRRQIPEDSKTSHLTHYSFFVRRRKYTTTLVFCFHAFRDVWPEADRGYIKYWLLGT
jgi:hypothetical protein